MKRIGELQLGENCKVFCTILDKLLPNEVSQFGSLLAEIEPI